MNFIYTTDLATKSYLENNNYRFIQEQFNESGIIYVFENKANEKFDKSLGLKVAYLNKLRF